MNARPFGIRIPAAGLKHVRAATGAVVLATTALGLVHVASGQEKRPFWLDGDNIPPFYEKRAAGQNIAPAFEGWNRIRTAPSTWCSGTSTGIGRSSPTFRLVRTTT